MLLHDSICISANIVSQRPSVLATIPSQKFRLSLPLYVSMSLFRQITLQIRAFSLHDAQGRAQYVGLFLNTNICNNSCCLWWHINAYMHKCVHMQTKCRQIYTHIERHKDADGHCPRPLSNAWAHARSEPEYTNVHFLPHSHLGFLSGTWEREISVQEGGRAACGFYIRYDPTDRRTYSYEEGKKASNAKGFISGRGILPSQALRSAWFHQTYYLDSVSRRGCDVPGALLAAGVLVWPVGAAQGPAGAVDLMLTLGWTHKHTHRKTHARKHTHREEVKIMAAQEKVRGNGKGTGRIETREPKEKEKISKKHILMTSSVWISHGMHARFKQTLLH